MVKIEKLAAKNEPLEILTNTAKIDSNRFYSAVYPVIESTVFSLPRDRGLLDQTWRNKRSKKLVIHIDRIKIDARKFTRHNTDILGFRIKINKLGKIVDAEHYSKVKDSDLLIPLISDELLIPIVKELKTKSIPPYSLLGIPVEMEMPVTVKIIDSITVPSREVVR